MTLEKLHGKIDKSWDRHLSETRRLLRMPSISMTGEGIEESAHAVGDMISKLGAEPKLFRGGKKSHPLVTGHLDVGAEKTALVYGMYDVMPVGDIEEWDHPPFGATIVRKKPYGEVLVNRGVANSKGALAGSLLAIRTMVENDEMPMNVHFLIEGEEELGGFSLPKYVFKNKERLSKADAVFTFDYGENAEGIPVISFGMKGCVYFDLEVKGTEQTGGPMEGEVHSSEAVWIHSPVWRLVHAISTMVDENQQPTIDGLWDDVRPPSPEDLELVKKLAKKFDPDAYKRDLGVSKFKAEGSKEEMLKKYIFEPSVNIDGLIAGFTEDGTKTVLPPRAKAKIDIRIVPDMTIEKTRAKVMDHLKTRGFTDVKMRNYEDYPWSKVSPAADVSKACVEAMRYHEKEPEVWPMHAGSAPYYLFDQVLGVPWTCAGLGHGGRAHAPNEFAVVKGMKDFEKSVITVFWKYSEISSKHA